MAPNTPPWAVGYLQGQARAYRRDCVTLAAVQGAVKMAIHFRVPPEQIAAMLRESGLTYDAEQQIAVDLMSW